ncbi:MAG TPA: redox-regulated ATPase YchF [Candidatus Eremiobacteraeota bacterium]|nr:MAG: Ribosome-binding ATPase YchF [bacterium ADurb.Bin363]HPZ09281.1 redox-regulated ATPase YchF [Candidatus Eremiobacteraeota bacterium]
MGFKCGIVGLPNVGKSTLFNALTSINVEASNYPFCTINPNIGIVPLRDSRLDIIEEVAKPGKKTCTSMEFVDIAGLVKGASRGEGLGNQFLAAIREVDAIAHVVRCFNEPSVVSEHNVSPSEDINIIHSELIEKDLETVRNFIEKIYKKAQTGIKEAKILHEVYVKARDLLEKGTLLRQGSFDKNELEILNNIQLLTIKPEFYVFNISEEDIERSEEIKAGILKESNDSAPAVCISAKIEEEINGLSPEEQKAFRETLNLDTDTLERIVRCGYELLKLVTFFTVNQNEGRAWTVSSGTMAVDAAGKVHSDFKEKFIRVEVVPVSLIITHRSFSYIREKGMAKIRGKDYIVEDGDILLFKI